MTRIRSRLTPLSSNGYAVRVNSGVEIARKEMSSLEAQLYPYERHYCEDTVNQRTSDNPLLIVFEGRQFVPLDGRIDVDPTTYRIFENHIPSIMKSALGHATGISSLIPSIGTVATAALARSNPSKPYVSVPNFLYELKDLPGMIRDIGNLKRQLENVRRKGIQQVTAKNSASHLLSYQMGWAPLISDLQKLIDFQAQVDKKLRDLQGLYNGGGLQRKVRSPAWKATKEQNVFSDFPMESVISPQIRCDVIRLTSIERWATVRWYPKTLPDTRYSSQEMAKVARDLTFGMHRITAKQLWDAIPWTWLIGWFSNVDEFLQAHHNAIPLTHSTPCVMTKTETKTSWTRTDLLQEQVQGGYGAAGYSTKERITSSGTLSATIPFLNGRQISILGALAIQRKR